MSQIDPFPTPLLEPETSDYVEHINSLQNQRLIKQGLLHYSGHVATILSGIFLVPLMLHQLGAEAYGLWIVALAVPGLTSGLDNTLYLSVARETGLHRSDGRINDPSTTTFLTSCCGAYVVFGVMTGALLISCESVIVRNLHLSPSVLDAAPATFLAVAFGFAARRVVLFGNAVLAGFQRFGTINAIAVAGLVLRFSGFAILLELHRTLKAIAAWYAIVSITECALMIATVRGIGALALNRSLIRWRLLARSGDFAVSTLLTSILQNLYWSGPPILLGFFRGTSATITLYAGQRPGFIISDFTWRGAEVVFSAAASNSSDSETSTNGKLIVFGTKCLLAVAMPLCIGLLILAPIVVQIWLHTPRSEMTTVMRLTSIGVIGDALWVGPLHALWGRGHAKQVLLITTGVTALILILNIALIPQFGATGSAAAFVISTCAGAIVTSVVAVREAGASATEFFRQSFSEVFVPSMALAVFVLAVSKAFPFHPRLLVAAAVTGGGPLYSVLYWKLLRTRKSSDSPIQFWIKRILDRI